jgi:predicted TIM-barrel fold metal-dependent hydrolase
MEDATLGGDYGFDVRTIRTREDGVPIKPVTIVSADSHIALPPRDYIDYLDPQYRSHADEYFTSIDRYHRLFDHIGYPLPPDVVEVIDTRNAIRSGGELGAYDPARRLREVEAEGVVAEFLHPNGPLSQVPFYENICDPSTPELRAAGARAHNRFARDFAQYSPGRLLPVYLVYPWPDMAAAVEDCRMAAEAGGKAVVPPQQAGAPGDPLPALYDPYYDPFWAACQDLGLAVHVHAGFGNEQGCVTRIFERSLTAAADLNTSTLAEALDNFVERRPLWQLMWGGVFDRFPRLKVVFVEIHCDWVPETLTYLDEQARSHRTSMALLPSEYWQRHCAVGASIMRFGDAAVRHQVGLRKLMFGTDYPHMEGSWPNTLDFIRVTMSGFSESEVRQVVGDNAIDFYGLDRELLESVALRCGPLATDLVGRAHAVDPRIVDDFDRRSGVRKPANMHGQRFINSVDEDIEGALSLNTA